MAHFANFGEVVDYQVDETGAAPCLTIRYKSRKDAEVALSQGGKSFPGCPNLEVRWHLPPGSAASKVKSDGGDDLSAGQGVVGTVGADGEQAGAEEVEDEEEENEVMPCQPSMTQLCPFSFFSFSFFRHWKTC